MSSHFGDYCRDVPTRSPSLETPLLFTRVRGATPHVIPAPKADDRLSKVRELNPPPPDVPMTAPRTAPSSWAARGRVRTTHTQGCIRARIASKVETGVTPCKNKIATLTNGYRLNWFKPFSMIPGLTFGGLQSIMTGS